MNHKPLALALAAAILVSASGCSLVIGGGGSHGDVTFHWTFGDQLTGCALASGVADVVVEIPGQALANQGVTPCRTAGIDGITFTDFSPGDYRYTLTARDQAGGVLYVDSGTFSVDGSVTVRAVLQANPAATGGAYLTWSFAPTSTSGGQLATCAQTPGVVAVQVLLDDQAPQDLLCTDGQTASGTLVTGLTAGPHTILLLARDAGGVYRFRKTASFSVAPGVNASQHFTLDWAAGLALRWSLSDRASLLTCGMAGVSQVTVNLKDGGGAFIYPGAGYALDCALGGAVFSGLVPGTYQAVFQATSATGERYLSSAAAPPRATAQEGIFPALEVTSPTVPLSL